jgi:hypothetical protein
MGVMGGAGSGHTPGPIASGLINRYSFDPSDVTDSWSLANRALVDAQGNYVSDAVLAFQTIIDTVHRKHGAGSLRISSADQCANINPILPTQYPFG